MELLYAYAYATVFAVGALMVLLLVSELPKSVLPGFLSFISMWSDAVRASRLLPAIGVVGAIAVPTTLAAAYLVKRDISVGS